MGAPWRILRAKAGRQPHIVLKLKGTFRERIEDIPAHHEKEIIFRQEVIDVTHKLNLFAINGFGWFTPT